MIPILFYKFSLKHIFLLLLGRCANAEFCDKFMFHLWENCQTVFQGNFTFLPQCLMVLFSCTRHFCFHSNYSPVCMRWAGMCAPSPLHFSPKHTFLPKDLLFSGDMLSLGFIHTWAQSLGPLSSVEHFLNVIPLCSFLCPILFCVHLLRLLLLVLFPPPLGYSESSPHNECNSKSQSLFPWILQ